MSNNKLLNDPWATNETKNTNGLINEPWKTSPGASATTNPWLPTNNGIANDPWSSTANSNNKPSSSKIDEFDLFTTNRVNTPTNTTAGAIGTTNSNNNDPFGDFFGGVSSTSDNKNSTNPWNSTTNTSNNNAITNTTADAFSSNLNSVNLNNSNKTVNPTRKTPESFLGENSSLVNLDNLIPSRPKSTNPFGSTITHNPGVGTGLTSSTSSGQLNNPFLAQQQLNQKGPTISQLQQQSIFPFGQTGASNVMAPTRTTPTPTVMQPFIPTSNTGQLAQPLIPPQFSTTTNSTMMPFMGNAASNLPVGFGNSFSLSTTPNANQPSTNSNNNTNPFLMM